MYVDFETFSEADLKKVGSVAYAAHPSTRVLCMGYAYREFDKPQIWIPGVTKMPKIVQPIRVFNKSFERAIFTHVLGMPGLKFDDIADRCRRWGLPHNLKTVADYLKLDNQKDLENQKSMYKLNKPTKFRITQGDYDRLYEYCKQDVEATREIDKCVPPLEPYENAICELLDTINQRGIPIDTDSANMCLGLSERANIENLATLEKYTSLTKASTAKFKDWLIAHNLDIQDTQKATLEPYLSKEDTPKLIKEVIECWLDIKSSSKSKIESLLRRCVKNTIYDCYSYYGASTGRMSSRGVNMQNMPRGADVDNPIEILRDNIPTDLSLNKLLKSSIRQLIRAPDNKTLLIADFSSIEARVLAYLADEQGVLEVFSTHGKLYEATASGIYGVAIDQVTKDQRFIGKVATLALGFGGGKNAFIRMAEGYGVEINEDFAQKIVEAYRKSNKNIYNFWYKCQRGFKSAMFNGVINRISDEIYCKHFEGLSFINLPSGRNIYYQGARVRMGATVTKDDMKYTKALAEVTEDEVVESTSPSLFYDARDSITGKFKTTPLYGGKICENIVQAVARDIMCEALIELDKAGFEIIMNTHDEVVALENDRSRLGLFTKIMETPPPWIKNLAIKVDAFSSKRYTK